MARVESENPRWQYRQSVRDHVREPLRAARTHVQREKAEIHAERGAFQRFADKVEGITPVATAGGPGLLAADRDGEKRAAVREAYEETVLALEHYDEVYDEPLLVNVAGELSAEIAQALRDEAGVAFTEHLRTMIRAAAEDAAERREEFQERLDDERDSLADAHQELREVTDALDGSGLPAWYRPSFEERLDELVGRRQRRLHSRAAYRRDGHDLCEYIYDDEEWTYPVLTAVARLRNSVA